MELYKKLCILVLSFTLSLILTLVIYWIWELKIHIYVNIVIMCVSIIPIGYRLIMLIKGTWYTEQIRRIIEIPIIQIHLVLCGLAFAFGCATTAITFAILDSNKPKDKPYRIVSFFSVEAFTSLVLLLMYSLSWLIAMYMMQICSDVLYYIYSCECIKKRQHLTLNVVQESDKFSIELKSPIISIELINIEQEKQNDNYQNVENKEDISIQYTTYY